MLKLSFSVFIIFFNGQSCYSQLNSQSLRGNSLEEDLAQAHSAPLDNLSRIFPLRSTRPTNKPSTRAPTKLSTANPTIRQSTKAPTTSSTSTRKPSIGSTSANLQYDVIIIGCGIAGIGAAQALSPTKKVLILEARNRIGGRMYTDNNNFQSEMGAAWVQNNKAATNPTVNLITKTYGLHINAYDFDLADTYAIDGSPLDYWAGGTDDTVVKNTESDVNKLIKNANAAANSDSQSLYTALNTATPGKPISSLSSFETSNLVVNLEDEYGVDIQQISAKYYNNGGAYTDVDGVVVEGYSALIAKMAVGLNILTNKVVKSVTYQQQSSNLVTITTTDGSVYTSTRVIVTVPLGVLKKGSITFNPPLPAAKTSAINSMGMGVLNHVYLQFPPGTLATHPAKADHKFSQLDVVNKVPQTTTSAVGGGFGRGFYEIIPWYHSRGTDIIMGEASASFGVKIESMTDAQILNMFMSELRLIDNTLPNYINYKITRWGSDPYAYGSYSAITAGNTPQVYSNLASSVNNQLFFAGEHTVADYPGLVQGALASGQKAAAAILKLG